MPVSSNNPDAVAERLAALGWLSASISHELMSPLQTILSAAEELAHEEMDPARRSRVEYILNDARRCERIVSGLLGLARGEVEPSAPYDLMSIAQESCDVMRRAHPEGARRLRWEPAAAPLNVTFNATLLQQVVLNLLNNALQAAAHGDVLVRVVGTPRDVRIEVIDHGPGIPAENLSRVFDPFFTTKPKGVGTGLGLNLCRHIVEAFGGRIWAEKTPGGGATFVVELPLTPRA